MNKDKFYKTILLTIMTFFCCQIGLASKSSTCSNVISGTPPLVEVNSSSGSYTFVDVSRDPISSQIIYEASLSWFLNSRARGQLTDNIMPTNRGLSHFISSKESYLFSPNWLRNHFKDKKLRFLDIGCGLGQLVLELNSILDVDFKRVIQAEGVDPNAPEGSSFHRLAFDKFVAQTKETKKYHVVISTYSILSTVYFEPKRAKETLLGIHPLLKENGELWLDGVAYKIIRLIQEDSELSKLYKLHTTSGTFTGINFTRIAKLNSDYF